MPKYLENKKGQSIVEISVALTVVIIIMVSVFTVVVGSRKLLNLAGDNTRAISLAQEGIDIATRQCEVCAFGVNNPADKANDYFYIDIDTTGADPLTARPVIRKSPGVTPNNIKDYNDFDRRIYIYKLEDLNGVSGFDWATSGKPAYNFSGMPTWDQPNKYYYIEVDIQQGGQPVASLSTLIQR